MSDRLKTSSSVSNEEIIEDLTKDLEFTLKPGPKDSTADFISPSPSSDTFKSQESNKKYSDTSSLDEDEVAQPEKCDSDSERESDVDADTDVDEEALKDAELELTVDQREERRICAEELKELGNHAFKDQDYERSIEKYTEGLRICPLHYEQLRAVLYSNRGAAKMKLERHKSAVKDCTQAVQLDEKYLKAYVRRAQCYEVTDQLDESLEDFKKVLELDPNHSEAKAALYRLPPRIQERNEKLKNEMFDKLKHLGNIVLRPFGLSTDNFKLEQDPDTQGYKINFQK